MRTTIIMIDKTARVTAGNAELEGARTRDAAPDIEGPALLRLLAWMSPSFPVGAFSYSHGLERVVEDGAVRDSASLEAWIAGIIEYGSGRSDATLLASTFRAVEAEDWARAAEIAELAAALQPSRERRLEAVGQGNAFLNAVHAAWPRDPIARFRAAWLGDVAYPVAAGLAAGAHGLELRPVLAAYLHAFAASLISAGIRLVPLGQTDGLKVTAAIEPVILATVETGLNATMDDLGAASFLADIASMRHETQYTRLFRS